MSLMKWIIISTIISLPLIFLFPDSNVSDGDSEKILAQIQFNDVCNDAYTHGCQIDNFKHVYDQCTVIYGNISLDECKSKCCDTNSTLSPYPDFLAITMPQP